MMVKDWFKDGGNVREVVNYKQIKNSERERVGWCDF